MRWWKTRYLRYRWNYRGSETVMMGGQPFRLTRYKGRLIGIETWEKSEHVVPHYTHYVWKRDA